MRKHIILFLLIFTASHAHADKARVIKIKPNKNKSQATAPMPEQNAMMGLAMQSVMQSLSMEQIGGLAGCLEQYFKSKGIATPDPGPDAAAQSQWAQEFMASPTGQAAIQACQGQIQTLLPQVQQKMQQQSSQDLPANLLVPASPQP